ncbi:Mitochondrial protein [Yarrowia sp. B02]|nr:Mitochondrial protein [Yarrowia sp. B02]
MGSSCKDIRTNVAICLQRSPCVMVQRNTPKDCLTKPELVKDMPEECVLLMNSFLACRRGMVDMTKRFRGNAPLSTGKFDDKYEKISTGHFNPEDELITSGPAPQQDEKQRELARLSGGR